jgi:hypothetical protein
LLIVFGFALTSAAVTFRARKWRSPPNVIVDLKNVEKTSKKRRKTSKNA